MTKNAIILAIMGMLTLVLSISCSTSPSTSASQAPTFTLTNMMGSQVNLSDFKGQKPVLLLFTSYSTGGLMDPLVKGYITQYQGVNNLQTLCVVDASTMSGESMSGDMSACPMASFNTLPLMDSDGSVCQSYHANPNKLTAVLVDREGNINFQQQITSTADTNSELSGRIKILTR
jgi:peroxiredoxin